MGLYQQKHSHLELSDREKAGQNGGSVRLLSSYRARPWNHLVENTGYSLRQGIRDGNTRPPYLPPEKPVCKSRTNS